MAITPLILPVFTAQLSIPGRSVESGLSVETQTRCHMYLGFDVQSAFLLFGIQSDRITSHQIISFVDMYWMGNRLVNDDERGVI